MIKEIMLASALTLAQPPFPHFYNVEYNYNKMYLNFFGYDYQHYNSYIINLNNGTTQITNLYINEDGVYQKSGNTTSWVESDFLNFHDYCSWLYYTERDNYNVDLDNFVLELDFESYITEFVGTSSEIVIECFFAIPGEDDSTLINVSGPEESSQLVISTTYNYAYLYVYEWYDVLSWLQSDNSYLVLNTDSIEGIDGSSVDFDGVRLFINYSNIGMGDGDIYYYSSYDSFIYDKMRVWLDYALELEERNEELTDTLVELQELYNELRQENEELNSRHVLSNVFEIVRGAFDGVINFLEIELMPNLTIGTIIFIPVVIGVIFFILKALVL